MENKNKNIFLEYENSLKKFQEREFSYVQTITALKQENLKIKARVDQILTQNFEKELALSHSKEKNTQLMLENNEKYFLSLKDKITIITNHLALSEANRNVLQEKMENMIEKISFLYTCPNCESYEKEIFTLNSSISMLKSELKDYKEKFNTFKYNFFLPESEFFFDFSEPENSDLSSKVLQLMLENKYLKSQMSNIDANCEFDDIDENLKQYSDGFTKVSSGQYVYNNMKINIFMENGGLYCRVGNVMLLNDFLMNFNNGSSSTTPCENSFKEAPKGSQDIISESGEFSYTSEEDKKEDLKKKENKTRQVVIKKQFRPDKKVFAPLRQSSAHLERKKTGK